MAGGAGGIGRPGANIAAGMPQGQAQQSATPSQSFGPNVNNFAPAGGAMPTFNQPAISPMQQYMQSIGINRAAFNPGQMMQRAAYAQAQQPQSGYAQSRPVPTFQPAINPNVQRSSANAADPAKPTDYQRMRDELDQLRAWQSQYTGNNGGGGGGN